MDKELNLDKSLRPGLDILGSEIVIALKKRSRFKQNLEIYSPGLVIGRPDVSLLEYELARMEQLHAELGRYTYASQEAFTNVRDVNLIIQRTSPECPINNIPTNLGPEIVQFYIDWIRDSCEPGTNSDTFGETVTADVGALLNIYERIILGKYIAEYKFKENPDPYIESGGDPQKIEDLIVDREREMKVLALTEKMAEHYDFSAEQARRIFQWVIKATVKVEVQYIQNRIKNH
jgi:chorismate mutase